MNLLNDINQTMSSLIQTVQQSVVRFGNGRSGFGAGTIWLLQKKNAERCENSLKEG